MSSGGDNCLLKFKLVSAVALGKEPISLLRVKTESEQWLILRTVVSNEFFFSDEIE